MSIIFGSARSNENYKSTGGSLGDQRQKSTPDYSGEVSMQTFYEHKLGWYILRAKNPTVAQGIADAMIRACNNANIGYDQNNRLGIVTNGTKTTKKCGADCGTTVRTCVKEASGKDPGNFTTSNEVSCLEKTGLFETHFAYTSSTKLYTGDILVTKSKGHTGVITSGIRRTSTSSTSYYSKYTGTSTSIIEGLKAVGCTDTSMTHRKKIAAANNISNYSGTATQNTNMLNLLKQGKLIKA